LPSLSVPVCPPGNGGHGRNIPERNGTSKGFEASKNKGLWNSPECAGKAQGASPVRQTIDLIPTVIEDDRSPPPAPFLPAWATNLVLSGGSRLVAKAGRRGRRRTGAMSPYLSRLGIGPLAGDDAEGSARHRFARGPQTIPSPIPHGNEDALMKRLGQRPNVMPRFGRAEETQSTANPAGAFAGPIRNCPITLSWT
jgi:hypothetical protein